MMLRNALSQTRGVPILDTESLPDYLQEFGHTRPERFACAPLAEGEGFDKGYSFDFYSVGHDID